MKPNSPKRMWAGGEGADAGGDAEFIECSSSRHPGSTGVQGLRRSSCQRLSCHSNGVAVLSVVSVFSLLTLRLLAVDAAFTPPLSQQQLLLQLLVSMS